MDIDEAIIRVRAAASRVDTGREEVADAKRALHRAALKALVNGADEQAQAELIRRLYWDVPELPVKTIQAVLGSDARVHTIAGPGPLLGTCADCGAEVHASSRTNLAEGGSRCAACQRKATQWRWRDDEDDGPPSDWPPPSWDDRGGEPPDWADDDDGPLEEACW